MQSQIQNETVKLTQDNRRALDMDEIVDNVKAQYSQMAARTREEAELWNQKKVDTHTFIHKYIQTYTHTQILMHIYIDIQSKRCKERRDVDRATQVPRQRAPEGTRYQTRETIPSPCVRQSLHPDLNQV